MIENEEVVLCKIECEARGKKRMKSDSVVVTQKRIYKTGMTRFGQEHKKVVSLDTVSCAEWREERFVRFPVLGLAFLALCCLLSAYFLPGDKAIRFIVGLVIMAIGVAVMILCVIAYFRLKIKTLVVYYGGGTLRIASPGISDEDAEEFVAQVLRAAERVRREK